MSIPVTELVFFTSSEAFRSDPASIINNVGGILGKSEGMISAYHGPEIEDPSQAYLVVLWETLEHHKALISSPSYPALMEGLKPAIGGPFEMLHAKFNKDPTKAFTAPVTEIAVLTATPGKPREEIGKLLDVISSQEPNSKVTLSTWGPVVEKEDVFILVVGWESLEAHKAVVASAPDDFKKVLAGLRDLATLKVTHAKLVV